MPSSETTFVFLPSIDDRVGQVVLVRVGVGRRGRPTAAPPGRSRPAPRTARRTRARSCCASAAAARAATGRARGRARAASPRPRRALERGTRWPAPSPCVEVGRRAPSHPPARYGYFRQNCSQSFLYTGWMPAAVLGVHPLGEERARLLVAVRRHVGLLVDDVLVERGPLVGHVLRILAAQLVELLVELRVADEALVERHLGRRASRVLSSDVDEVARVRVVLEPVGEPGLGLRAASGRSARSTPAGRAS